MRRTTILLAALAALMLVPAAQAFAALPTMTVAVTGSGEGEAISGIEGEEPGEILFDGTPPIACKYIAPGPATETCQNTIDDELEPGEEPYAIWLEASPSVGSKFTGWTTEKGIKLGGCKGQEPACFMAAFEGEELKATANFVEAPTLKVIIEEGSGTVTGPGGFKCTGTAPHECTTEAIPAGEVSLLAEPETPGNVFKSWSGCATHVGLSCKLTLSKASKPIKVKFTETSSLSLTKSGSGYGKAGATGISCDESCSGAESEIANGKSVTVKTKAAKGSAEAVLSGTGSASACSGTTCTFTITEGSTVNAEFVAIPTNTLTVNLTGPAYNKGKVKGKATIKNLIGAAISCGAGCTTTTESFLSTDSITLEASASTGYTFEGWSGGGCSGKAPTCAVPMSSNQTVSAEFK